jgi:hypothetical protein
MIRSGSSFARPPPLSSGTTTSPSPRPPFLPLALRTSLLSARLFTTRAKPLWTLPVSASSEDWTSHSAKTAQERKELPSSPSSRFPGLKSGPFQLLHSERLLISSLQLLTKVSRVISLRATPYVPSFLSFREAAPLASLLEDLRATGSPVPQVLFVDGNGRFHVRQAGSAVAIGLLADLPTVGVGTPLSSRSVGHAFASADSLHIAKEYHPTPSDSSPPCDTVNDFNLPYPPDFRLTQKGMRSACRSLLTSRGDWIGLTDSHGEYLGAVSLHPAPTPVFYHPHSFLHRLSYRLPLPAAPTPYLSARGTDSL